MGNRRVHPTASESYAAEATIAANRFVVHGSAADGCTNPAGANAIPVIGVARFGGTSGQQVVIDLAGCVDLTVNGASVNIAAGDPIKVGTTTGIGVKAATDKDHAHAVANEAATADGVLISVRLCRYDIGV